MPGGERGAIPYRLRAGVFHVEQGGGGCAARAGARAGRERALGSAETEGLDRERRRRYAPH